MADHPDELSSLLAHYNLPVDVCNEQVSDVHLEEISSSHCKEWRRLPSHLELESIMASDIDRKQVGEGEKRREFFFGWKEREGSSATYESLIRALWKIRCRQDAGSICKLLQASTSGGGVSGATSSAAGAVELQSTATSDLQRDETVRKGQQKSESDDEGNDFPTKIADAVFSNKNISRKLAHGILVGPTGSGKSSLMDRLLGRPRKKFSPSTGVSEPVVVVDIDIVDPSTFHSVTMMDHNTDNTWTEVEYNISLWRQMNENVTIREADSTTSPPPAKRAKFESSITPDVFFVPTPLQQSLGKSEAISPVPPTPATKPKVLPTAKIVRRAIKKFGGYKKFKRFLKKSFSLYLRDTGDQVEFQEMIPLLVFGPSIVFFVFRLDLDFKKKFEVKYRKSAGESLNCYISSITTEEAFLQSLATVDAMDMSSEASVKTHKPKVFIIGTHRDKLGPSADKKIAELNEHLSSLIKNSGFRDLVQYADRRRGHVMFTVDNTSGGDEDFKLIRSRVSNMIRDREEFTIEYPIRYLLFSLELQNLKCNVLSLDECKVMAAKYGIEEDQLVHLLQFLHLRIGVIRYFDKDGVRHIVIKEPQVLFNTVTDLIIKTFSCGTFTVKESEDFEKKGILTASVLVTALKGLGDITPEEFLQLLVHLHITAPFSTSNSLSEKKRYFFPSVLNHVPESTEEEPSTEILPLAVTFKCRHCPKGLFGVLVTHLLTPYLNEGATSHTTTFTLMQDKIFKDQVSFEVRSPGVVDEMALKLHPSHLEIKFFPEHSKDRHTSITEVCSNVRQIVETSIHQSLQNLHYSESKVSPATCLRCEDCSELHEVEIEKHVVKMHCKKTRTTRSIPDQGKWWYREGLDQTVSVDPAARTTKSTPTHRAVRQFLKSLSNTQLREVGLELGLHWARLKMMTEDCLLDEMLDSWLRKEDDVIEISGHPSWQSLVKALEEAGYAGVAAHIKESVFFSTIIIVKSEPTIPAANYQTPRSLIYPYLPVTTDVDPSTPAKARLSDQPLSERKFNLMLYGVPECNEGTRLHERAENDLKNVLVVLGKILPSVSSDSIRDCIRIGKYSPQSTRPLLVRFVRARDVRIILQHVSPDVLPSGITIKRHMSSAEMETTSILLRKRWKLYTQSGVEKSTIRIRGRKLFIDSRQVGEVVDGVYRSTDAS